MKPICIIPARGGSKRLPRKNILPLAGKPLVLHVIESAKASGVFSEILVSSDDEDILKIASAAGVVVHKRPEALGRDNATVVQVCVDILKDHPTDEFCCLYATAVLLKPETIRASYEEFYRLSAKEVNVLMGVSEFNYHPVQALKIGPSGEAELLFSDYHGVQSQFYPKVRVSNGTLYWARAKSFIKEMTFYSESLRVFDISEDEAFDIDTPLDYQKLVSKHGE